MSIVLITIHYYSRVTIPKYGHTHRKFFMQSDSRVYNTLGELLDVGVPIMDGMGQAEGGR